MALSPTIVLSSLKERFTVRSQITVCILFIAGASLLLPEPHVARGAGAITEYPIPLAGIGIPTEITTGADGNLWFLESTSSTDEFTFGHIHRMTIQEPISFTIVAAIDSKLSGITSGQFGEILFAEPSRSKIGRIFTTFGQTPPQIEEIDVLPASVHPRGVASLGNAIWFTSSSTGQIGRIPLNTGGTATYYDIKTPFSRPSAITIGPDNKSLYFISEVLRGSSSIYEIGRIAINGSITVFPIPDTGSRPKAITAGLDGNIWFTDPALNSIWRLTPDGSFASFQIRTAGSDPMGIVASPDGNLYFTEFQASQIGIISYEGVIKDEIPTPTRASGPSGITVGSDGNIWFIEANASRVGRLDWPPI